MIVFSLCAMVNTVLSANSRRMVFWISSSVSRSTAAVASSRTRILLFLNSARARHINCRWPTLQGMVIKWILMTKNRSHKLLKFGKTRLNPEPWGWKAEPGIETRTLRFEGRAWDWAQDLLVGRQSWGLKPGPCRWKAELGFEPRTICVFQQTTLQLEGRACDWTKLEGRDLINCPNYVAINNKGEQIEKQTFVPILFEFLKADDSYLTLSLYWSVQGFHMNEIKFLMQRKTTNKIKLFNITLILHYCKFCILL